MQDGQPCKHPGCLSHITHPCEGCGRIDGRRRTAGTVIQAQIDETLKLCDRTDELGPGWDLHRKKKLFYDHAREMLPLYARALKEAVRQHRDELRCSDPTCACRGSCGKLDTQMNSILKLLSGENEKRPSLAAAAILNSREATGVYRPIAWRNPWPAQRGGA